MENNRWQEAALYRDYKLWQIEERGLQFLLQGQDRKDYLEWLKKPDDYKAQVYALHYQKF